MTKQFVRMMSISAAALFCLTTSLAAGTLSLTGATDKDQPLYAPGETMIFSIQLLEDGKPLAGRKLKWWRKGDDQQFQTGEALSSATEPLVVATSLSKPGFVRLTVDLVDDNGQSIKNEANQVIRFDGGAGVEIDKIQSIPEPADFDAFWQRQNDRLRQVPIHADLKEVPSKREGFVTYDVRIDCPGGKRVSGYLTMPKDAEPKSLAANVQFQGYGVSSAGIIPYDKTMVLSINAHGIENGREQSYYDDLKKGELKEYAFKNDENANPENAYFNGMALRVIRALEYIKTRPEWNGKILIVSGGSQGGLQSLWAAGQDQAVTECRVSKPWCCDLAGITLERQRGWRPDWLPAMGYYDGVYHARRIKCPVTILAGLGDYTCPPSGLAALYNALEAPKKMTFIQGSTHMVDPKNAQTWILESK